MTPARARTLALGGTAVAGVIVLFAAGRVWGETTVTSAGGARVHTSVTGHDVAGALVPCGGALLAFALVALVVRGGVRRATGVLVVVVGALVVVAALVGLGRVGSTLAEQAFGAQLHAVPAPATVWPWVCAVAGLVAVGCGGLTAVAGGRWPGLGRRYDAPGTPPAPAVDDDASRWAALDRGEDPTA